MPYGLHFIIAVAHMRIHNIINALQEGKVGAFISRKEKLVVLSAGRKSWCFYQQAIADEKKPPLHATSQGHQLAENVANAMVPVYERMSDTNLLGRMVKGKTQNANESLHSVIWSRCPKTVFVGVRRVCGAVASAIARFNEGTSHISQVMEKLAIE